MKNLQSKVKKLPLKPGVYQFIGKSGEILYVGRATLLRRRVQNYFTERIDLRIKEMVESAKDIKFIQTDSVLEAIILEANLIKKYWPKYNVKDRDDRSFIYILISKKADFPKPIIVRGKELSKYLDISSFKSRTSEYHLFGPYQSLTLVNQALKIIRGIFPYGTCTLNSKPCFYYQIGLCPGACAGKISKQEYGKNIKDIVLLLSGEKKRLLVKLKKENPEKIQALKHIHEVALLSGQNEIGSASWQMENGPKRIEGYDISHMTGRETYGSMVVFENGVPDNAQYRLFKIKDAPQHDDLRALEETLSRRFSHSEWPMPDIIIIDGGKPQIDFMTKLFKERNITVPFVGISKFKGDELIFPSQTKKTTKELILSLKPTLLKVRDEAHRFANKASAGARRKPFRKGYKNTF